MKKSIVLTAIFAATVVSYSGTLLIAAPAPVISNASDISAQAALGASIPHSIGASVAPAAAPSGAARGTTSEQGEKGPARGSDIEAPGQKEHQRGTGIVRDTIKVQPKLPEMRPEGNARH